MKAATGVTVAAAVVAAMAGGDVAAQAYPTKPIRVVVPQAPGGSNDIVARFIGGQVGERWKTQVVVDNRPGAEGMIGSELVARAAPDGYTLCHINSTQMSVNPHVMRSLSYDVEKDFRPITNLYNLVSGVFVSAALAPNTLKEFEALVKSKPAAMNMSTHGPNTPTDVYRRWLNERWGTDMTGIGYKDGTAMISALMAGDVQFVWIGFFNALGQMQAKKVKMLAVSSQKRYPLFPEVPTFDEAGIADAPMTSWQGLAGPGGLPEPMVRRINTEIVRLFNEPEFGKFLVSQGLDNLVGTPEAFAAFMRKDRAEAGEVIRRFNIPRE